MPRLAIAGLEARYGSLKVLDGIDLDVASGDVIGLIGPSGSGKSTVLRALVGLTPPDIIAGIKGLIDSILSLSTNAIREVLRYLVYGAVIVVPIWLLMRVFARKA